MNLNEHEKMNILIRNLYNERSENFLDLLIESKNSGMAILEMVKKAQMEFLCGQVTDSIIYVTFNEKVYDYISLRMNDFHMIKKIYYCPNDNFLIWVITYYIISMNKFDKIIMNPPYKYGNKIWQAARKSANEDDSIICLMPPSCLKNDKEYKYVKTIQVVGGEGFDAIISNNNSIITNCVIPNNLSYEDISFITFNQNYILYYEWNRDHFNGLELKETRNVNYLNFDINTDFVESNRCCQPSISGGSGGGFGTDGCGYAFNVNKKDYEKKWINGSATIKFKKKEGKDNFSKWWYLDKKGKSLSSKTLTGLGLSTVSSMCKYALPQIDWEAVSDHPLWIDGKYDEAVLDTMGLKWNETMTGVVKK